MLNLHGIYSDAGVTQVQIASDCCKIDHSRMHDLYNMQLYGTLSCL